MSALGKFGIDERKDLDWVIMSMSILWWMILCGLMSLL